ncbi:PREDICTED: testis-specific protein TEX28 [Galeopterus variegatus]|uniref:Testis-specific protein TEX28 n=1 Tax=Galeopterus variegatus TaxID=482537 RepID=A0ABM0R7P7_GALVR|nr:PREDICTED: testis-specific protein TEX28 [Galeopterus variegatus]
MEQAVEYTKNPSAALPSNVPSCRSLSSSEDGPSGHSGMLDGKLSRNLQDSIKYRILYLSEQLRVEKASRDENTMAYLKLVSKANRHQAPHIREAFEKVNQRTSATIAQIERRLRQCHQQLQELQGGCRPTGLVLKVESSLDNFKQPGEKAMFSESPKLGGEDCLPASLPDVRHFTLESHFPGLKPGKHVAQQQNLLLQKAKEELEEVKKLSTGLQASYHSLKETYVMDLQVSLQSLQEEKYRQTLLEEQVKDYMQGHLNEVYHLKQNLVCIEERMAYLSFETTKEIWEVMENFKSRISKLETLQQATQLEMTDNLRSRAREFLFRFVSLLLTLATFLLICVSTVCTCPLLLANCRLRVGTVLMLVGLGALAWQKWHTIPSTDWQAWVPSTWKLYSKDSMPPSDGPSA